MKPWWQPIEQQYKGYRLSGDAEPVSNYGQNWYATGARMGKSVGQSRNSPSITFYRP
jgi:hypothetical protein